MTIRYVLLLVCLATTSWAQTLTPYHTSVNLQQESITPYFYQEKDSMEVYHYKEREEHEIKYGRPIINKDFNRLSHFHTFFEELSYEMFKNYEKLLELDIENSKKERMFSLRQRTLRDLEYAVLRSQTIETNHPDLEPLRQTFSDLFTHLYEDFKYALPTYMEAYYSDREYRYADNEALDKSYVNFLRYDQTFKAFFAHVNPLIQDLFGLLHEMEQMYVEPLVPELKKEYILRELHSIALYRNDLNRIYRKNKQYNDAYILKLGLIHEKTKDQEDPEVARLFAEKKGYFQDLYLLMDSATAVNNQSILDLKRIPKYKSDISFKNEVNKYVKFLQTSSKGTFKKIISALEKSSTLGEPEWTTAFANIITYREREQEYLKNITDKYDELVKKYKEEAKAESRDQEDEILQDRERAKKLQERIDERDRKNYWKSRNLPEKPKKPEPEPELESTLEESPSGADSPGETDDFDDF